jgi:serine/threonine protein kinase
MTTKQGWLTKQGGSIKTWKKRWCVLKSGGLFYSKSQEGPHLGVINLTNCGKIHAVANKGKKNCFEVETPERVWFLFAETESERDSWVEALNYERERLRGGQRTISVPPKVIEKEKVPSPRAATVMTTTPQASIPSAQQQQSREPEKVTIEDFDLLNVIGRGSFGKVFQVRKKNTGKIFALKVLNKKTIIERNEVDHTKAERNILQKLIHPFLMNLHYSFQTPDKLYFVMDYVNGGELFYHLQKDRKFSEERTRFYCAEIVLGLEYLHSENVIYRDLKPENLLLTQEGHICLTDFGIAKEGLSDNDRTDTFCGTPEYLAPEILENNPYGKGVDWWSFGTLMYEMLNGLPPFYSQDIQEMYTKIISAPLEFPQSFGGGPDAKSLIKQLLERDPEKRLTDPKKIKAHPFFKVIDWDKLYEKEITPPYIPPVSGKESTELVDPTFTSEQVSISPDDPSDMPGSMTDQFKGFTYMPETGLQ